MARLKNHSNNHFYFEQAEKCSLDIQNVMELLYLNHKYRSTAPCAYDPEIFRTSYFISILNLPS
jgi:hypothetical protein